MSYERTLNKEIRKRALINYTGDYYWHRRDIIDAMTEIYSKGYGVIGGEICIAVLNSGFTSDSDYFWLELNVNKIITGNIPLKSGDNKAYFWSIDINKYENWSDFKSNTLEININEIINSKIEEEILENYSDLTFYTPIIINEDDYNSF